MSKTMYVAKKRIVEYAGSGLFNYGMDRLHNILDACGIGYSTVNDACPEYDEDFEVNRNDLHKAVEELKAYKADPDFMSEQIDLDAVDGLVEEHDTDTVDFIIETLEWMDEHSDKENHPDWIYVSFF